MNISINKEPIKVKNNIEYIVIDALYIDDIREKWSELEKDDIINEIRNKVFPYTDTPFAQYISKNDTIGIEQIKRHNNISNEDIITPNMFSVDSGILIFINRNKIINFVSNFSYNELINYEIGVLNINYWKVITSDYSYEDIALILSPGIGSGIDFEGSGTYCIV